MHGVTAVRDAGSNIQRLGVMDSIARARPGVMPRMVFAGDKIGPAGDAPFGIAELKAAIDERQRGGASYVKMAPGYPDALLTATLRECAARDMACVAHVPTADTAAWLGVPGPASYEHLFNLAQHVSRVPAAELFAQSREYEEPKLYQRVLYKLRLRQRPGDPERVLVAVRDTTRDQAFFRQVAASGAWFTPTMILHRHMTRVADVLPSAIDPRFALDAAPDDRARTPDQERAARETWALFNGIVRAMWRARVNMLAGTDFLRPYAPGSALQAELVLLQQAGIPAPDVLRMATINPARFLGALDTTGTVSGGKVADLVVLRSNPLEDIARVGDIEMVMTRGVLLRQDALAKMAEVSTAAATRLRSSPASRASASGQR